MQPAVESFYHLADAALNGKACNGTACFIARHLNQPRWSEAETQDPRVYCLGKCFAAPASMRDNLRPHVEVRSERAVVLDRIVKGGARTLEEYLRCGGYGGFQRALTCAPEQIVRILEISGLRGRGGAGFPVGRKWRAVLQEPSPVKYIVANADEGDPGAYIDRFLLEDDPHVLLEGMLIAARAVGASKGWIYLRKEYPEAEKRLRHAIEEACRAGFLRPEEFEVGLFIGQGSYVCGEETAMLNSIEGRRPEVRARPPYCAETGLWGYPTLVNNVETFANIPWILQHGGEEYRTLGCSESRGTKVVSLNSLFRRPGLYEIDFGITVRQIVDELGGGLRTGPIKGVIIGGPLAGIIPPQLFETPFAFEEIQAIGASVGHGGFIAFDAHTSIAQLIHHVFSFGAYESCGKCTPCRLGSRRIEQAFRHLLHDEGADYWDEIECIEIIDALKQASLCGLGSGLAEFAESALRHYGKELETCFR